MVRLFNLEHHDKQMREKEREEERREKEREEERREMRGGKVMTSGASHHPLE